MNRKDYNYTNIMLQDIKRNEVIAAQYIPKYPTLRRYGLPDDIEEQIKRLDNEFENKRCIIQILSFLLILILGYLYGIIRTHNTDFALIYSAISMVPAIVCYILISRRKPPKTKLHYLYDKFKDDVKSFYHWNNKKSKDYWLKLSGTAFEYDLAELYNLIGYKANLTKASGDKGVDIILEKDYELTIVQCKAHKSKISPQVAKKLFESMNYFGVDKGVLASVSGFTPGVYEYINGKNITLVDINNILKMIPA